MQNKNTHVRMFSLMDLSINQVFLKISTISRQNGVELSYSAKNFYYSLLEYCDKNGFFNEEKNAFYVDLSVASLCKEFGSSSHVIQSAISSLNSCGLIERIEYKPSFCKISSNEYSLNSPSRIYINYNLLKE